jgi:hypothetical protein
MIFHISTIEMDSKYQSTYMTRRFSVYHIDLFFKIYNTRYKIVRPVEQKIKSEHKNFMIAIF